VEDNPTNQIVALGMLGALDLSADIASNGKEAIVAIKMATQMLPYTIVLMDCQMPEMDGYDATRAVRRGEAGEENKQLPIIAMTANAMSGDREKCIVAGMDDYIAKPISLSILKSMLIKWVSKEESSNTTQSNVAQIESTDSLLWDESDALKRLANKRTLLNKIIELFMSDGPMSLAALAKALEEKNSADAQLHAHSLKGSSGNVSALKLYNISKHLEEAAKNNNLIEVQKGFAECEQILNETLCVFKLYLSKEIEFKNQER
jgi:CheY-like chemotaxis protein